MKEEGWTQILLGFLSVLSSPGRICKISSIADTVPHAELEEHFLWTLIEPDITQITRSVAHRVVSLQVFSKDQIQRVENSKQRTKHKAQENACGIPPPTHKLPALQLNTQEMNFSVPAVVR